MRTPHRMRERDRIRQFFAPLTRGEIGSFQLTDDAATLTPPPRHALVVTTDSVIEGVHVLPSASPQHYAQKLLRRNLSDLAAMGAKPWRYTLNIHRTAVMDDAWFAAFTAALLADQETFNMLLIGGDSTSGNGPIHLSMTCLGLADGAVLRRDGAKPGDDIYVSGTIGDAALGLTLLQQNPAAISPLVARYHLPEPRLELGLALRGIASAAMDISDGLIADLTQLCEASSVGAILQRDAVPLHAGTQPMLQQNAALWPVILNGGDDYELLFTAHPSQRAALGDIAKKLALPCTRIGSVTSTRHVELLDGAGHALPLPQGGWEHA